MATNNAVNNIGVTQAPGTNNTTLATTAFVQSAVSANANFVWTPAPSTPVTGAVNNAYLITDASAVTITAPNTAAVGSVIGVVGNGAGGWTLNVGSGQTFKLGNTSAATSLASTNQYDSVFLVCTVANTTWVAYSVIGNLTVT
jgi:hypothetical protein